MIKININKDEITIKGHSGYAESGSDIVCASVSSITITTVNALLSIDEDCITYEEKDLLFNKFLLERYLNEFKFKKEKIINNVSKMKKDYRHLFYIDNKYMTENTFLKKMFDIKGNL